MKQASSKTEFLSAVRDDRPCFLRIEIKVLKSIISDLSALDLHCRPATTGWNVLRGLCPLCTSWIPGETLGMSLVIEQMGRSKVTLASYSDISHLIDARCINDNCTSQDILLIWQGDQLIKRQLVKHLERVRADAITKNHESQLSAIKRIVASDILAFSQDALFGLESRCKTDHLIVGRRFENLVMWVSVLPPSRNAAHNTFPSGYRSYLGGLLHDSGFERGDIIIAHWISFIAEKQRVLNLALLSGKSSIGTDWEFAILPAEIP